jgi:hypothetical protein
LTLGIILLFFGVAIAPTITFTTVKASNDNDLVEVTTQACGIKGYGDTTVKLTREQYQNLKQYLVDFRARLNQTTTREEAVPIFKEAVVELDTYGLLPKEMNLKQAQRLVLDLSSNYLCLVAGTIRNGTTAGLLAGIGQVIYTLGAIFKNWLVVFLGELLIRISVLINLFNPIGFFATFLIETGNITTVGLLGIKIFNIHNILDSAIISNFFGIKITNIETREISLLGFAGAIRQIHNP